MRSVVKRNIPLLLSVIAVSTNAAFAAEESAAEIARKSRERGQLNLLGLTAEMRLVTQSAKGASKEQVLASTSKEIAGRTHSISRFLSPSGVQGVAVLTIEGKQGEPNEISLYLPKLKRVRKVAKSQRGQSFMETDFNYADLAGSGGIKDEALEKLADASVEGREVFVLRGKPDGDSPYGSVTLYVDKQTYVPMKVEYDDKKGDPLKVYRTLKLRKFKDRVLAGESVMENVQKGSKTTLTVTRLEEQQFGDEAFSERALERG